MDLDYLLAEQGFHPKSEKILILRHKPGKYDSSEFRANFISLISEHPELFNEYQSTQNPGVEAKFKKAHYIASFVSHTPRQALFVGMFRIASSRPWTKKKFWQSRAYKELGRRGMRGFADKRRHITKFRLKEVDRLRELKGKLIIDWPGKGPSADRSWARWMIEKNKFSIRAILEESKLMQPMPDWTEIVWPYSRLKTLPKSWQDKLSQWRGVYFIFDEALNKGYVGSAYGEEDILQRWKAHFRVGGDAKYLRRCNSDNLVFSILEIDSHVRAVEEIREKERSWKRRLHTLYPKGLNANW